MTESRVQQLLSKATAEYEDHIAKIRYDLLICSGRCYGIDPDLNRAEHHVDSWPRQYRDLDGLPEPAAQVSLAARALAPRKWWATRSGYPEIPPDHEADLGRRMEREVEDLLTGGSAWASMVVNTTYLMGALTAMKPTPDDAHREPPFALSEVRDLVAAEARRLGVDHTAPPSWRWGATKLAWHLALGLLRKYPSPYFSVDEADRAWCTAIAAAIAEVVSERPKGYRRAEPRLWNLFHPPQPDSERPRVAECKQPSLGGGVLLRISFGPPETSPRPEKPSFRVERGPGMHDGEPTKYFALFVSALREAAKSDDEDARRVIDELEGRAWWDAPSLRKRKRPTGREDELRKRRAHLVTLDKRGRTLLFALGMDHETQALADEMDKAYQKLLTLDAELNDEVWSPALGRFVARESAPLHRHAVGPHLTSCKGSLENGWHTLPALYERNVSAVGPAGFQAHEAHRRWYTVLARDVFVKVSPLLLAPLPIVRVADVMGEVVDALGIDPYAAAGEAYSDAVKEAQGLQRWFVCRALGDVVVRVIAEGGSEYISAEEASALWFDLYAVMYRVAKDITLGVFPPKGKRSSPPHLLGTNANGAVWQGCHHVEFAAEHGDEYAQRVVERSRELSPYK